MDLWIIFITGLTIGGLTCFLMQGGLLTSLIANQTKDVEDTKKETLSITTTFLLSKFVAYIIIGFLLGGLGNVLNTEGNVLTYLQIVAGIYMVCVACNLLELHPYFRYTMIQPPKKIGKLLRNQSKSVSLYAPILFGAFTILIPCGTTLAMYTLAIASGSSLQGALIMGAFMLGTAPFFLTLGTFSTLLMKKHQKVYTLIAAAVVIFIGFYSINGGLLALDSPISYQKLTDRFFERESKVAGTNIEAKEGIQEVEIVIGTYGYTPERVVVEKGIPVNLKLRGEGAYSCASAFRLPAFGISKNLGPTESYETTFTPDKEGKFMFACSMGMYRGVLEVRG